MRYQLKESINKKRLKDLKNNESVQALKKYLPIAISMFKSGRFKQVENLGIQLPTNDKPMNTKPGVYNGNHLVAFYGTNSWAYTKLGKFINKEDIELLKKDHINIQIRL